MVLFLKKNYDKLIKKLEFFDVTRNNLLTFSFTSVLAVLGVALGIENMSYFSVWICLIPFFLIIPFAARISYYRLASSHINSFLKELNPTNMKFENGTNEVKENKCKHYNLIAWLVNHGMVFLGIATCFIFYFRYINIVEEWKFLNFIALIIPLMFTAFVYFISDATYSYSALMDKFINEWNEYAKHSLIVDES